MYKDEKDIRIPENLDEVIERGIRQGVLRKRKQRRKRFLTAAGGLAAAAALVFAAGISNPAIASQIPIIGHIFELFEDRVPAPGKLSQVVEKVDIPAEKGTEESMAGGKSTKKGYVSESNGLRVTISESYATPEAVFLGISIENQEKFPEGIRAKPISSTDDFMLYLNGEAKVENSDHSHRFLGYLYGDYIDPYTFAGIMRLDTSKWEFLDGRNGLELSLDWIMGDYHKDYIDYEAISAAEALDPMNDYEHKRYFGKWTFELEVNTDSELISSQVFQTEDTSIPYNIRISKMMNELTVTYELPEGMESSDYMVIVLDQYEKRVDYVVSSEGTGVFDLTGRDGSSFDVYICTDEDFFGENEEQIALKGYGTDPQYEEQRKHKSYRELLDEMALVHQKVSF